MLAVAETSWLYAPIIRVLGYYDIFRYPLRSAEIHMFLPVEGISLYELESGLADLVAEGRIAKESGLYYLPHQAPDLVARRIEMEDRGARMWRSARRIAWWMRLTPFVRAVFVSGQLCRYIADADSDIDYFIVTEPNRLWIVRTFFVIVRRTLLFNSRKYLCTNYFVTADNLEIRERNPYVACEVASLKPLYNQAMFEAFIGRNAWIGDHYPNFSLESVETRGVVEGGAGLRGMIERVIPRRFAEMLDIRLMRATRSYWHRKFPHLDSRAYDSALRTRRDESRAHPNDQAPKVLERYREVLAQYGINDD